MHKVYPMREGTSAKYEAGDEVRVIRITPASFATGTLTVGNVYKVTEIVDPQIVVITSDIAGRRVYISTDQIELVAKRAHRDEEFCQLSIGLKMNTDHPQPDRDEGPAERALVSPAI